MQRLLMAMVSDNADFTNMFGFVPSSIHFGKTLNIICFDYSLNVWQNSSGKAVSGLCVLEGCCYLFSNITLYLLTFSILFLWLHMYRVYVSVNLFIFPRLTNFLACTFYSNLLSIFNSMASQLQCIISFHLFQFQHYQFNKVQLFSRV